MQMSIYIRPRSKGSAFELRVKHKRLARPAYATLGSREAAEALGHRTLAALERGARAEDRQRALLAGYQIHLAKPIESRELIAGIASLVNLPSVAR
jgi:CheY-like chemotaxis protein